MFLIRLFPIDLLPSNIYQCIKQLSAFFSCLVLSLLQAVESKSVGLVPEVPFLAFLKPLIVLLQKQLPVSASVSNARDSSSSEDGGMTAHPLPQAGVNSNQRVEFRSCVAANVAWWSREVRHICLQLIATLLNPHNYSDDFGHSSGTSHWPICICST